MRRIIFGLLLTISLSVANIAGAQVVTTYYSPVVAGYTPAVTDFGFGPAYSPTVTYYANTAVAAVAPTTAYYAPAAGAVMPTTTYYAPAAAMPMTTYYAPAAVPVTAYYAPAVMPMTTYYAGSSVWVGRPRVYVAGEPVRNFFRALAP
jgi:hypothetical protein